MEFKTKRSFVLLISFAAACVSLVSISLRAAPIALVLPVGGPPPGLVQEPPIYGLPDGVGPGGDPIDIVGLGGRHVEPSAAYPFGMRGLDYRLNPDSPAAMAAPGAGDPFVDPQTQTTPFASIDHGHTARVLLHSGQEMLEVVDFHIPGRDPLVDLTIRRRHVTGVLLDTSPLGDAWAFNYDQKLEQQPDDSLLLMGYGREDVLTYVGLVNGVHTWSGASGRLDTASWDGVSALSVYRPGGLVVEYSTEGSFSSLVGHMTALRSPAGNEITFEYEDALTEPSLLARDLLVITDSFGRDLTLAYQNEFLPLFDRDLIASITDFDGRVMYYEYIDIVDGVTPLGLGLSEAYGPIVSSGLADPGTFAPEANMAPGTAYEYVSHADPQLALSLEAVWTSYGPLTFARRLSWTYDDNLASPTFGFVESHHVGSNNGLDIDAGGLFEYEYTILSSSLTLPNVPAIETKVTDRRGTVSYLKFNSYGQLLEERVETSGLRVPSSPSYTRTFTYNDDGLLTGSTEPLGGTSVYEYGNPAVMPRPFLGRQNKRTDTADSRGADQTTITYETIHEPIFNRPFKIVDPRGYESGNNPADYTTTYIYDYMEDLAAAKTAFAPQLGMTEAQLQAAFNALGVVDVGDVNGDGRDDQRAGNRIQVRYPNVTLPSQATQLGLSTTQSATETFVYNDFGQLIEHVDAEENVHTYAYYGADDPDGDGTIDVPGADGSAGGFLKSVSVDTASGPGRNSGTDPTPVVQTTNYFYDAGGLYSVANRRGAPTYVQDPRGIWTAYLVNELDDVAEETRAYAVPGALTAFAYVTKTTRDYNGNVIQLEIQNKDGVDGVDDFIVHRWTHDSLDFVTEEVLDVGNLDIQTRYEYDNSTNLIEYERGVGTADASTEAYTYDERDIVITHTRGLGSAEVSTRSTEIDDNGNITARVDATDDKDLILHDGFDRVREHVDRVGNRRLVSFDSASNPTTVQARGPLALSTTEISLALTNYRFDERGRLYRSDRKLFHYPGVAVGTIDDGALDPGDGFVSGIQLFDRMSRVIGVVDSDDDLTEQRWDGADRLLAAIDPLGNRQDLAYDQNDNVVAEVETETSGLIASNEIFTTTYQFDALDRPKLTVEPNGQETETHYDSRSNLIRVIDELGNESELLFDRLDRLVESRQYLSSSGVGANSTNADPTQGGGDGVITLTNAWDALHRLRSETDDNGNATMYGWDDLDRRVRTDYGDGTFETFVFNTDDELTEHTTQAGSVVSYQNDSKGRTLRLEVANADPSLVTFKYWYYDGLDRVWWSLDFNTPATDDDVVVSKFFDSLGRVIEERNGVLGQAPLLGVQNEYQGASRLRIETYPGPDSANRRKVIRDYDALDRIERIEEASTGATIALFDYVGPYRELARIYANGTFLDKRNQAGLQTLGGVDPGYDINRRSIRQAWKAIGGTVASYRSVYNGPGGVGTSRKVSETREHLFNHTDTYSFDSAYRILSFLRNGSIASTCTLDGADKMQSFFDEGANRAPVVDGDPLEAGLNQYSSFGGQPQIYDDNGSLVSEGAGLIYRYDWMNRLTSIFQGATEVARYLYDADNRRVIRFTPSTGFIRYTYNGWRVIEERDALATTGATYRQYVDGIYIDDHVQLTDYQGVGAPSTYYYHSNEQGSVGALTDVAGVPVEYYEYSWMGRSTILAQDKSTVLSTSAVDNPYMFHGRRYDDEAGFYYYRNRFYNPRTGEFITLDPMGVWFHLQGNGYSASSFDLWNWADPLGLGWLKSIQTGLDVLGMAPGIGNVADVANGFISLGTGDFIGAVDRWSSAVPGYGQVATTRRLASKGYQATRVLSKSKRTGRTGKKIKGGKGKEGVEKMPQGNNTHHNAKAEYLVKKHNKGVGGEKLRMIKRKLHTYIEDYRRKNGRPPGPDQIEDWLRWMILIHIIEGGEPEPSPIDASAQF